MAFFPEPIVTQSVPLGMRVCAVGLFHFQVYPQDCGENFLTDIKAIWLVNQGFVGFIVLA
ncbi:hypothetical protein COW36_23080 [bacterium (Candidatus Blackallbacteria) CG17_big_fil_post_rev_8_21_14_2_50_48_46]|uniref:Uncharacterized protein n=1 Tax=bacterium (Candidatus Blackallbacteria) CG17_big_fil_post_rev_8_21_14_2_50_48_46 TaxID=2014261 RepID=A0A2M7FYC1_9BACT|nr:MAG: hypothetical protein COW64_16150 [bacterium (Candidatus Blackallbacteria) CG18_big_fil_WC_8_21_14_2_50_49_26]PIW14135.1 MAG: hypothetical protein COW36_23080 [bacterium (Candidatus Blackallbacteria) CG17_big_fil_post_rev_8_21_14_2_50_48_46]PIW45865.1 MAG: hypothetical protein COW20_18745 [bacterium (Candidatus Blackallbacteria) CG13_big_fil_rev_8_21_14_2_50_49_14]